MIQEFTAHIQLLIVRLHIPAAQSLKDKRMVIRSIKDRARAKFNVSLAELDHQNKWQVSTLGFIMIGSDHRHVQSALQNLLTFIGRNPAVDICESEIQEL